MIDAMSYVQSNQKCGEIIIVSLDFDSESHS